MSITLKVQHCLINCSVNSKNVDWSSQTKLSRWESKECILIVIIPGHPWVLQVLISSGAPLQLLPLHVRHLLWDPPPQDLSHVPYDVHSDHMPLSTTVVENIITREHPINIILMWIRKGIGISHLYPITATSLYWRYKRIFSVIIFITAHVQNQ